MDTKPGNKRLILRLRAGILFALVLTLVITLKVNAEPDLVLPDVPWKAERLTFELSWFKVKAGTAVMDVSESSDSNGRKLYQISAVTKSNEFLDMFHKVRDRIDSFVYADNLASYNFKVHQEEGSYRNDKEIVFDYGKKAAIYTKNKETTIHDIPAFVSDALSALYYIRTKELVLGKTITIDVFDDKKLWQVEVQVLGRERVETHAGEFDTVLIKPILKFEGIFQRKGDVYIWLTDDSRKMPVKMRSKVVIGSVWADLVEYKYSKQ